MAQTSDITNEKGPIYIAAEEIVQQFYKDTDIFTTIEKSVALRNTEGYCILNINCSTLEKKWFFHTVSRFSNDSDFHKVQCLLSGLRIVFEKLERHQLLTTSSKTKQRT